MPSNAKGVITQQEKDRGRVYTDKQRKFLTILVKNDFEDPQECALKAGYSKASYWQVISSLKEDIKEITESVLLGASPRAAGTIVKIMESTAPIPNAQARLAASRDILDRNGIVKQETVNHNVTGGVFILPAKAPGITIDGEVNE